MRFCSFQKIKIIMILIGSLFSLSAFAMTLPLPKKGNAIIGKMQTYTSQNWQSMADIGRKFDVGYLEFLEANPGIHLDNIKPGTKLVVPTEFILPPVPRKGIVINLAELRLYYFPPDEPVVITFPVGIGKEGDATPTRKFVISSKRANPVWIPTAKTRTDATEMGWDLPAFMPAGPDNPLGKYSFRLSGTTILVHGTNRPDGVGKRVSGGCIRMYPEDIEALFYMAKVGTPVNIINMPVKAGWQNRTLYLEVHVPVHQKHSRSLKNLKSVVKVIKPQIISRHAEINWNKTLKLASQQSGIPTPIGNAG